VCGNILSIYSLIFYKFLWRCAFISKELQVNEAIKDEELRIVGADGAQMGFMSAKKALELAFSLNLDLVKIAPQAIPPVCKIMDYGKFRYEQAKREKEAKKSQHIIDVKEIRLSMNIDTHDFETKKDRALKFLSDGDKVKVTIRMKGREMSHPEIGRDIMKKFAESCQEIANLEKAPISEGRSMIMFLAPKQAIVNNKKKLPEKLPDNS